MPRPEPPAALARLGAGAMVLRDVREVVRPAKKLEGRDVMSRLPAGGRVTEPACSAIALSIVHTLM